MSHGDLMTTAPRPQIGFDYSDGDPPPEPHRVTCPLCGKTRIVPILSWGRCFRCYMGGAKKASMTSLHFGLKANATKKAGR